MLTDREKEALACISGYMRQNGFAPSVREMAGLLFVSHKTAHRYMIQLETKGHIKRIHHRSRAIQLCV